ncbi:MAG: hypothetical protein ACK5AZ_23415 [Bryobacteraceae bacterium]
MLVNNAIAAHLMSLFASVLLAVSAHGQTFTSIMNGENSTSFSFINSSGTRNTVTSIQSPFTDPNTGIGANDSLTYPTGSGSATPPWWFRYTAAFPSVAQDLTGQHIFRYPTYGQSSSLKSGVYGIRTKATFQGSGSSSGGYLIEAIFFGERTDWAGQREFGFFRQVQDVGRVYFYWSTNSNCSIFDNMGYPWCRTSQAPNTTENPALAPLAPEHFEAFPIDGLSTSTEHVWLGYLFWASWDSSYKFRVEVWDSSYTTQIAAFNADTINGGVNFGLTTSGMNGYATLTTTRKNPFSASNTQLSVSSVEIAQ